MHTFNIELNNGKQLVIPVEYYPRYAVIVACKENLHCITPITRVEYFFRTIGQNIFNPVFSVLLIISLSLCAPLLVKNYPGYHVIAFYFFLSVGFIISYYLTKFYFALTRIEPMSMDDVANRLGYKSSSSHLKPYDARMLKEIMLLNKIKIRRSNLYFDDLYGILFDQATLRRISENYNSRLRLIK